MLENFRLGVIVGFVSIRCEVCHSANDQVRILIFKRFVAQDHMRGLCGLVELRQRWVLLWI